MSPGWSSSSHPRLFQPVGESLVNLALVKQSILYRARSAKGGGVLPVKIPRAHEPVGLGARRAIGHHGADSGAAVQMEAADQHLLFEWGQVVLQRLHSVWRQLEVYEVMAYEDKVAAQVRTLDEATGSLGHLHKALVATRRQLQRPQRDLQRRTPGSTALQTGNRSRIPGSHPERSPAYRRCLMESFGRVQQTVVQAKATVDRLMQIVEAVTSEVADNVRSTAALIQQVKEPPWITFGSAVLVGSLLGSLADGKSSRASPAKDRSASPLSP
jgi:hypothetical protein